jgi:hypothetical protein
MKFNSLATHFTLDQLKKHQKKQELIKIKMKIFVKIQKTGGVFQKLT